MADRKFDSDGRPRPIFTRAADGRLRPAGQGSDIGDVWAEQRRIRLAEAIEEDKLKAAKKAKKQQKGRFFARRDVTAAPIVVKPKPSGNSKEIAFTINLANLPKLPKIPKLPHPSVIYEKIPKISKKKLLISGGVLTVAVVGFGVYGVINNRHTPAASNKNPAGVLSANNQGPQTPDYPTILPEGKDIASLGGWGRVSPPDKDPVFAYEDSIDGVQLNVSEQPLPDNFKSNIDDQISKLAKQFSATDKLTVNDDAPAYVGTSRNGPQSAIVAKQELLILIKSATKLSDAQWMQYINSLQ
jgi:hypothetical protein